MKCHLARADWVAASTFWPEEDAEALAVVERRVGEANARPVVLLDLDETLYDTGFRNHRILCEWRESREARAFVAMLDAACALGPRRMGYSMRDTFATAGVAVDAPEAVECLECLEGYWAPRFFSSEYVLHDRPYEGAVEFVKRLYAAGAELVYLTGRNGPKMGEGTRQALERDGFPIDVELTALWLKPSARHDDLSFKVERASDLVGHGEMVALFENEPRNLVALSEVFPTAARVFMDTLCSERPAKPLDGLHRVRGFLSKS